MRASIGRVPIRCQFLTTYRDRFQAYHIARSLKEDISHEEHHKRNGILVAAHVEILSHAGNLSIADVRSVLPTIISSYQETNRSTHHV